MSSPSSKLPNLNSQTEEFITRVEENSDTPLYKMSPTDARQFLNKLQRDYHTQIDADVTDSKIFSVTTGNIDIRTVRPKGNTEKLPAIIYAHGGGWVIGDQNDYDMLIRRLAVEANAAVIFPSFSQAPEFEYPKAINQIYATLQYVHDNPDEFNIDKDKLVIAGDSAGGNMATVTALKSKIEHGPKIKYQVLFYPVTNADMDTDSYGAFKDGPWLTKKAMEWFWESYVPEKKKRNDIFISPLKADEEDLKGMPPALIITDENDVLRDEAEAYARKLDSAGVEVLNIRINGTFHDFMMLNALSDTPQAKGAFTIAGTMIKKAVNN